jgi:6-phosphogluconolactonase
VLAFRRTDEGTLTPAGGHETGGAGDGKPHLTSQGSVVLTGDGRYLLVTNAASGDLSVFAVGPDGLTLLETVRTGRAPKSAEHAGLVYVLNTGEPSLAGFRLNGAQVQPLAGSARELAAGTDSAQVGFSPDGATLVVTQRGANAIAVYPVAETGQLGQPVMQPSPGPTPYGFAFTGCGGLVVTEAFGARAGKAAVSSYRITDDGAAPISRSVGNGRSEICWAVVTSDGRYAFTTNFGDAAVSRYSIGDDGSIALAGRVVAGTARYRGRARGQLRRRTSSLYRHGVGGSGVEQAPPAVPRLDPESDGWLRMLTGTGPAREAAFARLHEMLVRISQNRAALLAASGRPAGRRGLGSAAGPLRL